MFWDNDEPTPAEIAYANRSKRDAPIMSEEERQQVFSQKNICICKEYYFYVCTKCEKITHLTIQNNAFACENCGASKENIFEPKTKDCSWCGYWQKHVNVAPKAKLICCSSECMEALDKYFGKKHVWIEGCKY